MTPDEAHEAHAQACFDLTRRLAADLRKNPEEVWCRLANMPRLNLVQVASMALALVPAGPVDAWWDRDPHLTVVQRHRQDVLIGKAS